MPYIEHLFQFLRQQKELGFFWIRFVKNFPLSEWYHFPGCLFHLVFSPAWSVQCSEHATILFDFCSDLRQLYIFGTFCIPACPGSAYGTSQRPGLRSKTAEMRSWTVASPLIISIASAIISVFIHWMKIHLFQEDNVCWITRTSLSNIMRFLFQEAKLPDSWVQVNQGWMIF